MKALTARPNPVPTLVVKTLAQRGHGPQMSVRQIFTKARQAAPCLLLFEDIDSLVTDQVRSYFFNEVDGLEDNQGILMIGSTNNCTIPTAELSMRIDRTWKELTSRQWTSSTLDSLSVPAASIVNIASTISRLKAASDTANTGGMSGPEKSYYPS